MIDQPLSGSRRRLLRTMGALILTPSAAGLLQACGRSQPKLSRLAPDAVILAFGDSLTFGTGAGTGQSYPARLEALIGRKVVSAGIPGEVSSAGLARLPEAMAQAQPKLLLLCHGGNDLLRKISEAQTTENLRGMVRLAGSQGVAVVLIGVPKPGLFPSTAGYYADVAREFKLPYEDTILKQVLSDNALKSDLVHPNAEGYSRIARAIADLLRQTGAV